MVGKKSHSRLSLKSSTRMISRMRCSGLRLSTLRAEKWEVKSKLSSRGPFHEQKVKFGSAARRNYQARPSRRKKAQVSFLLRERFTPVMIMIMS